MRQLILGADWAIAGLASVAAAARPAAAVSVFLIAERRFIPVSMKSGFRRNVAAPAQRTGVNCPDLEKPWVAEATQGVGPEA